MLGEVFGSGKGFIGIPQKHRFLSELCLDFVETLLPDGNLVLASQKLCFLAEAGFSDGLCLFGCFGQGLFERFGQQSAVRKVGVVAVLHLQAVLPQAFGQLFCAVGRHGAGNGFAAG